MTVSTFEPSQSISVSEKAAQHIAQEVAKAGGDLSFRLYLQTSGCSGFMYETELVKEAKDGDVEFQQQGVSIVVPAKDLAVLNGTEIDFVTVGLNSMFQFKNPNVTGECGCGESFSVTEEA
ncbi:hypothetical protein A3715_00200 [Oleiphilus sp. HI0009]|uniref:HesB/IscA family protein n=1 Tax=unclassified Oleiphilus TaxID=2631174 RepID=UPI0007C346C1|nr:MULTISPECIES: iron-sulfur cluster assembly accessory protein [unclassified Oleiphilus]KZX76344.1 hypothetical protein A3715_21970 [Oleiphilus sp. HI0009]MCH2158430.1 iron-sulfur cluster assembly accessory protein [Oleiphilaceae bacterium]KZX82215.1 hypothetical protein A3715_00200 [Oleiphilus sp. HI0009]KZY62097.1 hypothetical protein A3738_13030 [Oleiphilus sp. HI0066]KZY70729.1 hypothetical protein A3739_06110 [Oleiphilus sp. HI0067]